MRLKRSPPHPLLPVLPIKRSCTRIMAMGRTGSSNSGHQFSSSNTSLRRLWLSLRRPHLSNSLSTVHISRRPAHSSSHMFPSLLHKLHHRLFLPCRSSSPRSRNLSSFSLNNNSSTVKTGRLMLTKAHRSPSRRRNANDSKLLISIEVRPLLNLSSSLRPLPLCSSKAASIRVPSQANMDGAAPLNKADVEDTTTILAAGTL